MHELSICQALIAQVEEIARSRQAVGTARVVLGVGPLSGVEPSLLEQTYPLACAGTIAQDSQLEIHCTSLRVRCTVCRATSDALPNRLICGECGDWRTRLESGDELLLESVELITRTDADNTKSAEEDLIL